VKKLLLILLCLPIIGFGQNLVTNGDFEQYSNLPTEGGQLMNCDGWNNVNLIPGVFFVNEPAKASPDYFHLQSLSSSGIGLPDNNFAFVNPYSGNAIVGFATYGTTTPPGFPANSFWFMANYREYISSKLNTPLQVGETYNLSFYLSNGESDHNFGASSDRIGVYFSTDSLSQDSAEVINVSPQLEILNEVWDTSWQQYSFSFIADQEYEFITIGNFYSDIQTTSTVVLSNPPILPWSYYFIDKIELYKATGTILEEYSANKELLKVTDLLGRETKQTNHPLLYIYDDGTVEKRIVIE